MQQADDNNLKFRKIVGETFKEVRENHVDSSLNNFARSYGLDRGNLSKIERGIIGCQLATAWKISEACGVKLSEVIKSVEDRLGETFKLIDE